MNTAEKRERTDWALLLFIIPIGIILIIIVGQLAIRLMPFWSVNADMKSNLEPNSESPRPFALLQPLMPQLLTPMSWAGNYLTPGADISFPEFVTFEPTASPSSTPVQPTGTSPTPTGTPSPTQSATPSATTTPVPTGSPTKTPTSKLCEDVNALNYGQTLPCKYSPPPPKILGCTDPNASNYDPLATVDNGSCIPKVFGCTDPTAFNYNPSANVDNGSCVAKVLGCTDPTAFNYNPSANVDNGSCVAKVLGCTDPAAFNYNPSANVDNGSCVAKVLGCTDPAALNYNSSANVDDGSCKYPVVSNPPGSQVTPPSELGVGTLPDNTANTSNNIGHIVDGTYIVVSLQVVVGNTPDGNYDLAFYEYSNFGVVYLDWIIIGISNSSDGSSYYEVFNWGDGQADTNSNVGDVAGAESDDQAVPATELYDPDGSGGPAPQSGILIDVDNAPSNPTPGTYNYVVIISPTGGTGGSAQVDAIQAVEEPIPMPTPTP